MSVTPSCNDRQSAPADPDAPSGVVHIDVALAVVLRPLPEVPVPGGGGWEVLVGLRAPDAVLGGLSEYPGGKVEPGEAPAAAAARELMEEMGIAEASWIAPIEPLCVVEHTEPGAARERSVRLHAFLVRVATGTEARALASSSVRWIRPSKIETLAWPRANLPIHAALARAIAMDPHGAS